ncbi:DUF2950 domain-containing protein [Uliginosibacterium sp. H3]|uniref:DUF2950 domain-containing protein n=1 Tax=Uliginosibacterium silvisoli TaxID=3114758 RepID=A0ABU6KA77_9RHOO|nr:DUF2950 domain-containing protein [Uliginosibacterium sp. H3]
MKHISSIFKLRTLVLTSALCVPGFVLAQAAYPTPEAAADALIQAVLASDDAAFAQVLGKQWRTLIPKDTNPDDRKAFLEKARDLHTVAVDGNHADLVVGKDQWHFPIPMHRTSNGKWSFDISGGQAALQERRIGANELSAMQAILAYVDAQYEYGQVDRNGDGIPEYARRFVSRKGKRDGLIWSPSLGDESPLGERFIPTKSGSGYHGYNFKILEAQGPKARAGARDYVIGNRLLSGYAAIAWPVKYGQTGVMTFIVNQDGVVYERNLGADTQKLASAIKAFNPDENWKQPKPKP